MPPTPLQQAMIQLTSLIRQWFEKILPGYYIRIKFANFRDHVADANYINRPSRIADIRFSLPFMIANVHNIKSDAFRKVVIHELAHIPDIQKINYELTHGIESVFVKRVERASIIAEKYEQLKKRKKAIEAEEKIQRLYHTYKPYRQRVKQYGGSESIADPVQNVTFSAYRGSKKSLVPLDIHQHSLLSCPKCRRLGAIKMSDKRVPGILFKEGVPYCKKCDVPVKTRKLTPDEVVKIVKLGNSNKSLKEVKQKMREMFPKF